MKDIPQKLGDRHPKWFTGLPTKLRKAVEEYNLPDTDDWIPLLELSSATEFIGLDVDADAAIAEGDELIAPATVHVRLKFGPEEDNVEFLDNYYARVFFDSDRLKKTVEIERIEVEVGST